MNILFFLKQKNDVVYLYEDDTLEKALEKIYPYRYTGVPVISKDDKYIGTITEGDVLWYLKNQNFSEDAMKTLINAVPRHRDNVPIKANEKMANLLSRSVEENFVPVLDEKERFLGIITRKEIIEYFFEHNFMVL